jgi:integrase
MASVQKRTSTSKKRGKRVYYEVIWRDHNKRQRSESRDTRREAERLKREIDERKDAGAATAVDDRWTVSAWLDDFNARAQTVGIDGGKMIGTARAEQYGWYARRVSAVLGRERLEALNEVALRRFRDHLLADGLERRSARDVLNYLKRALADARRHNLILNDIWREVRITTDHTPKKARSQRHDDEDDDGDDRLEMPTRTQMRRLLDTARQLRDKPADALGWQPDQDAAWRKHYASSGPRGWNVAQQAWRRAYVIVLLAALTGMRQGEIRGLYKRDIDLEAGVIRVRRAANTKNEVKDPKSGAGRRRVPITPELAAELRDWLAHAPAGKLAFPTRTGRVMDRSNIYHKVWRRLLEHAGMSECGLSFHSLRHYYASSIIAAGLGPLDVKKMMGHAKISTTYDLYSDLFPEDDDHRHAAAAAASQTLFAPTAGNDAGKTAADPQKT